MKKLILLMLVAMVPYFTIAQKRSKKGSKKKVETVASYEFMTIIGYEVAAIDSDSDKRIGGNQGPNQVDLPHYQVKRLMQANNKLVVKFEVGRLATPESIELNAGSFKSMVGAVNAAANKGWEFHSANVLPSSGVKIHYYYMIREK